MDKNKNNLYVLPILINRHITSQSKEMTIKEMVNLDKILAERKAGYVRIYWKNSGYDIDKT